MSDIGRFGEWDGKKAEVLRYIAEDGFSVKEAAQAVDRSWDAVWVWQRDIPGYREAVEAARAEAQELRAQRIRDRKEDLGLLAMAVLEKSLLMEDVPKTALTAAIFVAKTTLDMIETVRNENVAVAPLVDDIPRQQGKEE
jgi:hypothetical protein